LDALTRLNRHEGLAVLVSEHRLEHLLPVVQRVISVEAGAVDSFDASTAAARLAAVPPVCDLGRRLGLAPVPVTVEDALPQLPPGLKVQTPETPQTGDILMTVEGVTVVYGATVALKQFSLSLREGELVALIGPNGSGKSSLFKACAGLVKPASGALSYPGAGNLTGTMERGRNSLAAVRQITGFAALVPQDPALALYHESVRDELRESPSNRGRRVDNDTLRLAESSWGLADLAERNPKDISVGQQQRVAIAAMLAHEPPVWLLDEPTRGADGAAKEWLGDRLRAHARHGGAAIVATHDIESAARFATRVVCLENGELKFDLPVREAFGSDGPMPTQTARLVPGAVTVDEVSRA
jgi:energy-coupling factor transport system ATP-binding protein